MENRVWGMGNGKYTPRNEPWEFKKGTEANGGPDGFHYISKVLPTLSFC